MFMAQRYFRPILGNRIASLTSVRTLLLLTALAAAGCTVEPRPTPAPVSEARTVVIATRPANGPTPVISAASGAPTTGPAVAPRTTPPAGGIGNRNTDTPLGVKVAAYEPAGKMEAAPAHTQAVTQLITEAERKEREGNLDDSASLIERALKLEPRDAHLWYKMGWLRLAQHQYEVAEQFAEKSLSLAGGDLELKRSNWHLISQARQGRGDLGGAHEAEQTAAGLY